MSALPPLKMRRIWEHFAQGEDAGLESIDPIICDSWRRSRESLVDVRIKRLPVKLPAATLANFLEESRLYKAAALPMRMVSSALTGRSSVALLVDADGLVLETMGDTRSLRKADELGSVPGCEAKEERIGTDAVSCTLAIGRPTTVSFYEHYVEISHDWVGSAAPINHPVTKEIVGCLSIYGHRDAAHPAAVEFLTDAAAMIERQLQADETRARLILLQNYESRRAKSPNSELLCISRDGIAFAGSPYALNLIGLSPGQSGNYQRFLRVLEVAGTGFDRSAEPQEVQLHTKGGDTLLAEVQPVINQRELVGFVGILPSGGTKFTRSAPLSPWRAIYTFDDIICDEGKLADCVSQARRSATKNWPVLITGESGTGKELFAHAIHNASSRRMGPFVPVNCGGLTDELLSTELFGYADGAFTGATRGGRVGKMELANGGTFFLDEVEAMPPRMQVHLLRVLEEGRVIPVGAEKFKTIDVRVIAATNIDLEKKIKDGSFRRDLYYRLSVSPIVVPPLRERVGDIVALVHHFLTELGDLDIDPEAMERLKSYCWPGNARQLRNLLQQASMIASSRVITAADLPASVCVDSCRSSECGSGVLPKFESGQPSVESGCAKVTESSLHATERDTILGALRECRGNISRAASVLGVHRVTLHRKLESLGIKAERDFG